MYHSPLAVSKLTLYVTMVLVLAGVGAGLTQAGLPPSPNNPVQPLAVLQDQDAIRQLLNVTESDKSVRLNDTGQDLLCFRLVAPWHEKYIESWLQQDYEKELVRFGLELKCPESLVGIKTEERSESSHYVKGNGISLTREDLSQYESEVDWSSFIKEYQPQRRAVITRETNVFMLPGALTVTKPLHLASNVAADDKNIQDHWYHGQPVYILGGNQEPAVAVPDGRDRYIRLGELLACCCSDR